MKSNGFLRFSTCHKVWYDRMVAPNFRPPHTTSHSLAAEEPALQLLGAHRPQRVLLARLGLLGVGLSGCARVKSVLLPTSRTSGSASMRSPLAVRTILERSPPSTVWLPSGSSFESLGSNLPLASKCKPNLSAGSEVDCIKFLVLLDPLDNNGGAKTPFRRSGYSEAIVTRPCVIAASQSGDNDRPGAKCS
jgi:hypothetical protein